MSIRVPIYTWSALILLLMATIACSILPIGSWRQVINLVIAAAKAGLVLWFFMKLREEVLLVRLVGLAAGALLFVLLALLSADYALRPSNIVTGDAQTSELRPTARIATGPLSSKGG